MKIVEIDKATLSLANYTKKTKREPLIVTKKGKPVAALVGVENSDMETLTLSTHPGFLHLIEKSRSNHKVKGGISPEEMRERLNKKNR